MLAVRPVVGVEPSAEADTVIGKATPSAATAVDFVVSDSSSERYTLMAEHKIELVASSFVRPIEKMNSTAVLVSIVYVVGSVAVKLLAFTPGAGIQRYETC